jgi:hypothetical protein
VVLCGLSVIDKSFLSLGFRGWSSMYTALAFGGETRLMFKNYSNFRQTLQLPSSG